MDISFVRNRNDCAVFLPYFTFNFYKGYASSLTSSKLQEQSKDTKRGNQKLYIEERQTIQLQKVKYKQ
jgi:hypothetical protein